MISLLDKNTLVNVLTDYYREHEAFPSTVLSSNNEIGQTIKSFSDQMEFVGEDAESVEARIGVIVDQIYDGLETPLLQNSLSVPFEALSVQLAKQIRISFEHLRTCQADAEMLSKKILAARDRQISADPWANANYGRELIANVTYPAINWSSIPLRYSESELRELDEDGFHPMALYKILNQCTIRLSGIKVGPVEMEASQVEALAMAVKNEACSDRASAEDCGIMVRRLIHGASLLNNIFTLSDRLSKRDRWPEICVEMVDTYPVMRATVEYLKDPANTQLTDAGYEQLATNIKALENFMTVLEFFVVMCRRTIWHDSILLPNKFINNDTEQSFRAGGGQDVDLERHMKLVHGDQFGKTLNGLKVDDVLGKKPELVERAERYKQQDMSKLTVKLNDFTKRAIIEACSGFYREFVEELDNKADSIPRPDVQRVVSYYAEQHVRNGLPLDSALYVILSKICYKDDVFMQALYNKLGVAYVTQLQTSDNVDESTLRNMEISVWTELVANYIRMLTAFTAAETV